MTNKKYDASDIQILDQRTHVRLRPAMYISGTSSAGVTHLFYEIFSNSVDEFLAGYCTEIYVSINNDGSCEISDNGRGIPTDKHPVEKISAARLVVGTLNAGGKFSKDGGGYSVSSGLHGVGASVTNFLSSKFILKVSRDGKVYQDTFEKGIPTTKLIDGMLPTIKEKFIHSGTDITFTPDPEIFPDPSFKIDVIKRRIEETAFLNKGLKITLHIEKTDETIVYEENEGLIGYIKKLNADNNCITKPIYIEGESNDIKAEIVMQYITDYNEQTLAYCNNVVNPDLGTHVTGARTGLTRLINNYAKELNKGAKPIDGKDIRNGLVMIVSIKHKSPEFEGQIKGRLNNADARVAVEDVMLKYGPIYFDRNIDQVEAIIKNAIKSASLRKNIDGLKNKVFSKENQLKANGKLALPVEKDPKKCELFIAEGDSAGGSLKNARLKHQAILPIRGKILNVEKATDEKILANQEIATIILALGAGYGEDFDITKLKYDKVIIAADADCIGR